MQINLRAHSVNRAQAAKIALADAIIWLWLHQTGYISLFTLSYTQPALLMLPGLALSVAFAVGIIWARWDGIPRAIRACTAFVGTGVCLALVLLPMFAAENAALHATLVLLLSVVCRFVSLVRLETLAKCEDFSTLSAALSGSLLLFYLLDLILLLVPQSVYNAFIILAPLTLIVGINDPVTPCKRSGPLPKKMRLSLPTTVPCLTGFATGIVVTLGTVSMAMSSSDLFVRPAPLFLISQLLFLLLGIVTVYGIDLRKASYFSILMLGWGLGLTIGTLAHYQFSGFSETILANLSSFVCLLTIAGFFTFSGAWINTLGRTANISRATELENIAHEAGLTKRETEVTALLLEGRSLRIIQQELFISEGTARTHTKRIYEKLGIHSKQELIDYFKEQLSEK